MKARSYLIAVVMTFFAITVAVEAAEMNSYCYIPSTVGQVVAPNVLFVMDYSGSMGWCAYNPHTDKRNCCTNSSGCGWTYRGDEEGYFTPNKVYAYNSARGYWEESSGTTAQCPKTISGIRTSNKYMGSCLNFLYMYRVDLLRWAITGGKPASCNQNDPKKCDPELYGQPSANLSCDDYGCILQMAQGSKVRVPWGRINDALAFQFKKLGTRPRLGGMLYSGTSVRSNKVYIGDFTASANFDGVNPYKNLITVINYESPSGSTPTAPALWDAYNYFAQKSPEYGGFTPQRGSGDQWRNPMYQCVDENNNGVCQGSELKLVSCAKNFIILLTDGQWNVGGSPPASSTCTINTGFEAHSADPVVPAYWLHKRGFTNQKTGIYSYVEAIYGIGLWLGGTGELSLQNVAMYGSFDKGKTYPDSLTGYPQLTCTMDDCGSGKGSGCTPLPPSSSDWDKNGDGKPDTFYSASNAQEVKNAILNAMVDILRRVSSGTTVVALPPTSTTESSLMVRTYFYPEKIVGDKTIKWIGHLSALWFDSEGLIRENNDHYDETEKKKILDVKKDNPLAFVWSEPDNAYKAWIYDDLNDKGFPKSCGHNEKSLDDLSLVFDAGSLLKGRNPDERNIKTWVDVNVNGVVDSGEVVSFNDDNTLIQRFKNFWSYDDLGSCNDNCAKSVIKYIRGYDRPTPSGASFRLRQENDSGTDIGTAWKLGDTVYSTPRIVPKKSVNGYDIRYQDETYHQFINETIKNQIAVVIMGANDGMIHAFRIGEIEDIIPPGYQNNGKQVARVKDNIAIGKEEWAFIPANVIPYLRWYCQANYCRIPMLETTFTVLDASIGASGTPQTPDATKTKDSWRRLLIAQMGFGGTEISVGGKTFSSSIMVFDITDHLNPTLLWEKSLPDRTLTFATPGIVRLGDKDKNGMWYLVIGSGPKSITSSTIGYSPDGPKLYIFDLKTGELKTTKDIPSTSEMVAVGDILSTDLDLPAGDYQVDDLYFGTYNDDTGAFYRLRIRADTGYLSQPSAWSVERIMNVNRPVFAAPTVTHDANYVRWLYFGTGIYLTSAHNTITNEKFFGLIEKDACWKGTGSCPEINETNDLIDSTNLSFQGAVAKKYSCQCEGGITIRSGSCNPTCGSCGSGEIQVFTETTGAKLQGATGALASCNGKEEKAAILCIQSKIYEYNAMNDQIDFYKSGWKRTLTGEKLYSSPKATGGLVLATPFEPSDDPCAAGGATKLLAVYYTTGTPHYQPMIIREGGTTGRQQNLVIVTEVEIGKGPSPTKESVVVRESGGKTAVYTQASGGILKTEITQPHPPKDTFIQWLAK